MAAAEAGVEVGVEAGVLGVEVDHQEGPVCHPVAVDAGEPETCSPGGRPLVRHW